MFEPVIPATQAQAPIPVQLLPAAGLDALLAAEPGLRGQAEFHGFKAAAGQVLAVAGADGAIARIVYGLGDDDADPMALRGLAAKLAAGDYVLEGEAADPTQAALAFWLGSYRYDRYRSGEQPQRPRLAAPAGADLERVRAVAHACALARDMINTPANDMGPQQIEAIAREIAQNHDAEVQVWTGDALLTAGYPAVHAVGRAAAPSRGPRMIELTWGNKAHPALALVGKGVVFDTGGLDIKPSAGMRLMKKDMGGAAHALALGRMVMMRKLPVRLVVLIPVVENAIGGDAMRPGDVLDTRKGLSVEVGNTDAEGRLILADALTRAAEFEPALTLDLATLTGAARAAVGPQVVPFWTNDDRLAEEIAAAGAAQADPLWRLPLWSGYDSSLDSDIADLKNDPDGWAQAGSITAALFLKRFAPTSGSWAHFDIFGWNPKAGPGRPVGAEAQAVRALLSVIEARFV